MILTCMTAAVATLVLTPIVRQALLRFDMVDVPNSRSSHIATTARGGGIPVIVGTILGIVVSSAPVSRVTAALVGGAVALGVVGFVDDRRGLGPRVRLVAQVLVPAVAVASLFDGSGRSGLGLAFLAVLAVVWSVGYVNAFNFMDGINGISAVQASVAGTTFAILGESHDVPLLTATGLAIAASAIGFAPYNVWRTSVFLGDVGSYFIGSWLASLLIVSVAQGVNPLVAMGPFLLYLADTSTTIVRRALKGEDLLAAHREHAYQRLVQRGWSHVEVSVLAGLVMIATAGMMLAADGQSPSLLTGLFTAAAFLVFAFALLPNALDRLRPITSS